MPHLISELFFYFLFLIQSHVFFGAQQKRNYFLQTVGREDVFFMEPENLLSFFGRKPQKHAKQELYACNGPFRECNWTTIMLYYLLCSIARFFIRAIAYECDTIYNISTSSQRAACVCGRLPTHQ